MKQYPKRSRRLTAVLAVLMVLLGTGVAYAYWTNTGGGSDDIATGSNASITINQTSTVEDLAPGVPAQTLSGDFTNPNDGPVYVTSVTAAIDSVTKATGAPAGTCDATDYTLSNATMAVNAQVPAGSGQGAWSGATIAFNNKANTNQDACKGATVAFRFTSS